MRVTLKDAVSFTRAIASIAELISEGTFKFTKEGLHFIATDPANISMVILKMPAANFVEYEVEEDTLVGLSFDKFLKVLKRAKRRDTVSLEVKDGRLKVEMVGTFKKSFEIPILAREEESVEVPELQFKVKIELDPTVIKDAVKDASMVSDALTFYANKDVFKMIAESDEGKVEASLDKDSPSLISLEAEEESKAKYSIEYLSKIMKGSDFASTLILQFSNEYPAKFIFQSADGNELTFLLAPRADI